MKLNSTSIIAMTKMIHWPLFLKTYYSGYYSSVGQLLRRLPEARVCFLTTVYFIYYHLQLTRSQQASSFFTSCPPEPCWSGAPCHPSSILAIACHMNYMAAAFGKRGAHFPQLKKKKNTSYRSPHYSALSPPGLCENKQPNFFTGNCSNHWA